MNQEERLLAYIRRYGSITPLDAFRDLGITKLATIVSKLKREGKVFYQYYEKSRNRFGEPTRYMRYWRSYQQYLKDMQDIVIKEEQLEEII